MKRRPMALLATALFLVGGRQAVGRLRQNQLDDALVDAVQRYDASAVHRLLVVGANARTRKRNRRSVIDVLRQVFVREPAHSGNEECLALILADDGLSDRTTATAADSIAADLIAHGADVETDLGHYGKPLNFAAFWGLHRTVEVLLARHASVNARDSFGETPLFLADDFASERLLRAGADPNVENLSKLTPLCFVRSKTKAILLIDHGADVNRVASKMTVVDWTSPSNYVREHYLDGRVKLLRAHGALTYAELQARAKRSAKEQVNRAHATRSSATDRQ